MATAKKTAAPKADTKTKPGTAVAVVKKAGGSVVSLKDQMAAELATLAQKTLPPTGAKIKTTKQGQFKLPDGTETAELEVVIVDFITAHNFFPGKFDPKNIVPPVCAARGEIPTALVPFDDSPDIQAEACASCPMNQFGSDGDGKACKNSRLLAVLPPDASEDDPIWILEVSPTAIKGFDGYVGSVARQFQLPPVGVVTTVTLDPSVEYAKLMFGNPQPNSNLEVHYARKQEARDMLMGKPDFSKSAAPTKTPARKAAGGRR